MAGEYSYDRDTACRTCPAGYKCPDGATLVRCAAGFYSEAGADDCTECPAGSACPRTWDSTAIYLCEAGRKH